MGTAGVYEFVRNADGSNAHLQINTHNCIRRKTCDTKDPPQNITRRVPQGEDGPIYQGM